MNHLLFNFNEINISYYIFLTFGLFPLAFNLIITNNEI